MFNKIKIWWWKRIVAYHHNTLQEKLQRIDCGHELADYINHGNINRHRKILNKTISKLKKIDPDCPDIVYD
jgi:hypothetical protein